MLEQQLRAMDAAVEFIENFGVCRSRHSEAIDADFVNHTSRRLRVRHHLRMRHLRQLVRPSMQDLQLHSTQIKNKKEEEGRGKNQLLVDEFDGQIAMRIAKVNLFFQLGDQGIVAGSSGLSHQVFIVPQAFVAFLKLANRLRQGVIGMGRHPIVLFRRR